MEEKDIFNLMKDPDVREKFEVINKRRVDGDCPFCGEPIDHIHGFRDELSRREFEISGLCQTCQDEVFG